MAFLIRPVWTFSFFVTKLQPFSWEVFFPKVRRGAADEVSEHPIQQVIRKGVGLQSAFLWQTRTEGRILGSWMGICYRTLWEFYLGKHCLQAVCASSVCKLYVDGHLLEASLTRATTSSPTTEKLLLTTSLPAPIMDFFHFSTKPQKLTSCMWNGSAFTEYIWYFCLPTNGCIVQQYLWELYICGNISSVGGLLSLGILYLWELFIHGRPDCLGWLGCLIQLQLPIFPEFWNSASSAPPNCSIIWSQRTLRLVAPMPVTVDTSTTNPDWRNEMINFETHQIISSNAFLALETFLSVLFLGVVWLKRTAGSVHYGLSS